MENSQSNFKIQVSPNFFSNLKSWVFYFAEAVLLFVAFIFSGFELISFIDGVNYIKVASLLTAASLWLGQFSIKTFVLKKYNFHNNWKEFLEERFYPESAYFFCAYGLVLILRAVFFDIAIGLVGYSNQIMVEIENIGAVLLTITIFSAVFLVVFIGFSILLSKRLRKNQWEKLFQNIVLLNSLLLGALVIFTKEDESVEILMKQAAELLVRTGFVRYLLGSPIFYYVYAIIKKSHLAEKLSRV